MKTEYLIIGQGVSGTFLSYFFDKASLDYIVIDDNYSKSPSRVAAGLINPVTGRRLVKVWMDDIIIPFAEKTYTEIGTLLNIQTIYKKKILDLFPNPFMRGSFIKRLNQDLPYIELNEDPYLMSDLFNYEFGSGFINPGYYINLADLLPAWRNYLIQKNRFIEDTFDYVGLHIADNNVSYKDIEAKQIIFCDGNNGIHNPYFANLPFALNKGETLMIEAPDLPDNFIYKKSRTIVPMAQKGIFWVGTNYIWNFDNDAITEEYAVSTKQILDNWLKVPYKVLEHRSAVRPATVERRPFVGFHPIHKNVGILNGLGTKGCSLGPFFANQLFQNITQQTPIKKEALVNRFDKVLSR